MSTDEQFEQAQEGRREGLALAAEREREEERRFMAEEREVEVVDGLYRALRDCVEIESDPEAGFPVGLALLDSLLMVEFDRCRPGRVLPPDWADRIKAEFLTNAVERLLADVRTAVMILCSTGPAPGGRRHGPDPAAEDRCLCGWQSTAGDLTPIAHHFLALVELGGER